MTVKEEFLRISGSKLIKCAKVGSHKLKLGYKEEHYEAFLYFLDYEQEDNLQGTIWFTDGTWAEREHTEFNEYWKHHKLPKIPQELT